jgi:hypothetical protein
MTHYLDGAAELIVFPAHLSCGHDFRPDRAFPVLATLGRQRRRRDTARPCGEIRDQSLAEAPSATLPKSLLHKHTEPVNAQSAKAVTGSDLLTIC